MTRAEVEARVIVQHEQYSSVVEMEALTMIDMIQQHVIPSALAAEKAGIQLPASAGVSDLKGCVDELKKKLEEYEKASSAEPVGKERPEMAAARAKAATARELRLETMDKVRVVCDTVEEVIPATMWTLATYTELLFLDAVHGNTSLA